MEPEVEAEDEWAGVEPIAGDAVGASVCPIAYTEEYERDTGLLRRVLATNERSARALRLAEAVIRGNGAHYTAWTVRWECVRALGLSLSDELDYVDASAEANPKNYQIWNHRRLVAGALGAGNANRELAFTENVLDEDAKNYHAWQHRLWAVRSFGLWDTQLDFVHKLLMRDPLNNSAWNFRHTVVSEAPGAGGVEKQRAEEVRYACQFVREAPHNEAAWNYARGLCDGALAAQPELEQAARDLLPARHAAHLLADVLCERAAAAAKDGDARGAMEAATEAGMLFALLASSDPVRAKLWAFRRAHASALATCAAEGELA